MCEPFLRGADFFSYDLTIICEQIDEIEAVFMLLDWMRIFSLRGMSFDGA